MSRVNGLFAFVLGVSAIVVSLIVWLEASLMGFPDGYLTELQMARRPLYLALSLASVGLSPYFFYLAWIARNRKTGKKLLITLFIYLSLIGTVACIDYGLAVHLDDGIGG